MHHEPPSARSRNKAEHLSRGGELRKRSCSAVWREAGARSPEPATSPLGWTGAASPLDRCPGRNVPTHLHTEQDWRGHPGAHLSGKPGDLQLSFEATSFLNGTVALPISSRYIIENTLKTFIIGSGAGYNHKHPCLYFLIIVNVIYQILHFLLKLHISGIWV